MGKFASLQVCKLANLQMLQRVQQKGGSREGQFFYCFLDFTLLMLAQTCY